MSSAPARDILSDRDKDNSIHRPLLTDLLNIIAKLFTGAQISVILQTVETSRKTPYGIS